MTASPQTSQRLAGCRVVVSRAKDQAGALSEQLRALGASVLEIPFIEIRPPASYGSLDCALEGIGGYQWLILTSVNGVAAMFARMQALGMANDALAHLRVAAIGPATKKAIEARGLRVEVVPDKYVAESVVDAMRELVRGANVLLVRAKVARDVIPTELRRVAARVDVVEAYETVVPEESRTLLLAALADKNARPDVITFTSSSTAKNFAEMIGHDTLGSGVLNGVEFASIGPVTTATLEELGLRPQIKAAEYTVPGLVRAIVESRR